MLGKAPLFHLLFIQVPFPHGKGPFHEAVAEIGGRLFCGMDHIFRPPAVVAEFVHHDFVGGEVGETFRGEQQGALGQLVPMRAVSQMPDGADGEDELLVRGSSDNALEDGGSLFDRQPVARELGSGTLEAVGNGFAGLVGSESPGRSEGDDDLVAFFPEG